MKKTDNQHVIRMKFINLKHFRQDKGLSQKELVAITGLPQSSISYIENGYQEIRKNQLDALEQAFPEVDFSTYIFESATYPYLSNARQHEIDSKRNFNGDWSRPTPLMKIEGMDILITMGRAFVSFDGEIVLDRNDGTFRNLGFYVIEPDSLGFSTLINQLSEKEWFNDDLYEDFKRCYFIACLIVGERPVAQIKVEY